MIKAFGGDDDGKPPFRLFAVGVARCSERAIRQMLHAVPRLQLALKIFL